MSYIKPGTVNPYSYLPVAERIVDMQYRELIQKIMDHGEVSQGFFGDEKRRLLVETLRFEIKNGFPMMTERDLSTFGLKGAMGEIIGFINGAQSHTELSLWGCPWWKNWVTEEKCAVFGLDPGELGPGSYGAAFAEYPGPDGKPFDQFKTLIQQIKDFPWASTHKVDSWIPSLALGTKENPRQVVVAPCHGEFVVEILPDGKLRIIHVQRSADVLVGLQFNIMQYTAIGMMIAFITGYEFVELVHVILNAHIYGSQYKSVEKLLSREPTTFPTVHMDTNKVYYLSDFMPENFTVQDYNPHPWFNIPTPI